MLKFLIEIELLRQSLRRKILRRLDLDGERFFGVALIVLGIALTPAAIVTLTPSTVVVLAVGLVGLLMVLTIILLPVGLVLL